MYLLSILKIKIINDNKYIFKSFFYIIILFKS